MTERVLGVVSCLLGLAALSLYSARVGSVEVDTIPEIIAHRGLPNGQEVALTSDVKIARVGPTDFTVEQGGDKIGVRIPSELGSAWEITRRTVNAGDFISLRAVYRSEGYLEAREFHVHKGRRLKIWVSIGALLIAGVLIGKHAREGKNA